MISSVVYKLQSHSFTAFRAASCFFHSVTLFKFMWFYLVPCANTYVHISFLERLLLNSKLPTVSCSDLEWSGLVGEPDPRYLLPKPFLQVNRHTGHHTQWPSFFQSGKAPIFCIHIYFLLALLCAYWPIHFLNTLPNSATATNTCYQYCISNPSPYFTEFSNAITKLSQVIF